ncbi:hypothetical protein OMP43_03810 [Sphingomonas sp. CBMAI 2297]|uniref:hypothetical protein n=1 Tax=Sphingomonas sp. CBMAI 2297 TaxID=2991720 RepID=UPI00245557B0|nr:hypothetical protein [Sphingomonas sp. CBMAI 2297]MDH4743141.1 hypothetical protein [Sphingomonas sp. CBMAI 2297]
MPNEFAPRRFFALLALLLAAGCGASEQPKPVATSVPKAAVKNDGYYEPILNLTIDLGQDTPREGALLERAGAEVLAVGKAMTDGHPLVPGKIDTINFTILGPAGAEPTVGRKIAHFSLDGQQLRQLAHMGANSESVLDAAKGFGYWTPANDDVVKSYCSAHPSAQVCKSL